MHRKEQNTFIMPLSVLFICLLVLPAWAEYGGGTGRPGDPYLIYTAEQMNEIGANRNDWDKHFKLMADIDLSVYTGRDFNIIGTSETNAFRGVFDGNHNKISRFTSTKRDCTGLFGYVKDSTAEIKNLGLSMPNIRAEGGSNVGSLVGYLEEGTIANCYASGGSVTGKESVGGLVGYSDGGEIRGCYSTSRVSGDEEIGGLVGHLRGTIDNCYAKGTVSGGKYIGGLVGRNRSGTITNSMARGRVSGEEREVGGLVGNNSGSVINCFAGGDVLGGRTVGGLAGTNGGTVTCSYSSGSVSSEGSAGGLVGNNRNIVNNCYATGGVTGGYSVGGLVGGNTWPGKIICCYSTGAAEGTMYVGGLVGFNDEAIIKTSFWDTRTSGLNNICGRERYSIGCDDACGKTTAGMQKRGSFLGAGWDFVVESENGTDDIWGICEGLDYPQFTWQFRSGDFNDDTRVDFRDFAVFAERWLESDRSFFWCRGADLTNDGKVSFDDLKEFTKKWPAEGIGSLPEIAYIIIDDFESYNDLEPGDSESNRIFDTWLDGYYNSATNGSVVGYSNPPFTERNTVHGGRQSMPYFYNTLFKLSKAERPLNPPQDWTVEGERVLSLWFHGEASNSSALMSVVLNGTSAVFHDNANVVRTGTWTEWIIELEAFTGVDLTNVNSIAICFGDKNNLQAGGTGKMFFDDIRLYRPR
jgi:hypothetical protein